MNGEQDAQNTATPVVPGFARLELIGTSIYRAVEAAENRPVALEVLPAPASDEERSTFERGVADLAALPEHPALVKVYSAAFAEDGCACIVREYADHASLAGRMPPADTVALGLRLLEGLAVAHEAGVLHRAISPAALFSSADGSLRLGGFALPSAPAASAGQRFTAPDVAAGAEPSPSSDLYSLAATLALAMTGSALFTSPSATVSTGLAAALNKARAGKRYASAQEFRDALLAAPEAPAPVVDAPVPVPAAGAPAEPVTVTQPAVSRPVVAPPLPRATPVAARPTEPAPAPAPVPVRPPAPAAAPASPEEPARSRKPFLLMVALGALLVAGGGAAWWMAAGDSPEEPGQRPTSAPSSAPTTKAPVALETPELSHQCQGRSCLFVAKTTDLPAGATLRWEFGDGKTSDAVPEATHTYAKAGSYSAALVLTADGETVRSDPAGITIASSRRVLTVQAGPPGSLRLVATLEAAAECTPSAYVLQRREDTAWTRVVDGTMSPPGAEIAVPEAGTYRVLVPESPQPAGVCSRVVSPPLEAEEVAAPPTQAPPPKPSGPQHYTPRPPRP